ncbi:MAG: bifunctional phosphopantothenoylcysteine decarboxylase/phosphopantothenate--cysteine ligase CoaBC [Crocinitomicaceae bacterium]|nr:bifunctional phosphopantothenoylcysteine decarboxylase/phosphopantothenate--cysteine ligase CoaBC [Crocinitomicaceae bacterium]|tara:strand:+ start:2128 stop:3339 length:1212 start_codon:yes stop_codon:yes gene_type:complete
MLNGKKILLAVTGSIAAYKAAFLVRLLVKNGAQVKVVMSEAATSFITPLTLSTLSKHPVVQHFTNDEQAGVWNNHVELGMWADIMLVAPASANTLAKMAYGHCDNVLLATYLSAKCPVFIAPAMDLDMFLHPATVENIERVKRFGNHVIDAEHGELASGLEGKGRMAEPEHIIDYLESYFSAQETQPLNGKKVLITAGPTYEKIDPVRFIGNHSSGKMGFALAEEAAALGAEVELISGPSALNTVHQNIHLTRVTSAEEMATVVMQKVDGAAIGIFSAAVADYTPESTADQKIKKKDAALEIKLKPTTDILKTVGSQKKEGQIIVGFALETEDEEQNAQGKLERKNCDLIVLNSLNDKGAGFGHDTNRVKIFSRDNNSWEFQLMSKSEVAKSLWEIITTHYVK